MASVVVPLAALAIEGGRHQRDQTDLLEALASSRHIATAVGIVMDARGITGGVALPLLRRISTEFNVNLGAVAGKVNFSSSLPGRVEPTE
ncbi:ANTAR domain-containing protein [Knoellia sp. CPCC 206435]|uniref:ANTAR domain-containing protein n=1 Tax=Knoellia terrae TaxID=3404797 RepID=UPI003B43561C